MAEGTVLDKHKHHCGVCFTPSLWTWPSEMKMTSWLCTTRGRMAPSGMVVLRLLSCVLTGGYEDNYAKMGNASMPGQTTVMSTTALVAGRFYSPKKSWYGQHPSHGLAGRTSP